MDEPGEEPYFHSELIWCDDAPDAKVQMNTYRRDLGIRARPAHKGRMRKLSYEWLANLREIVIDSERCPLTFAEFVNKEYLRDRDGNWLDEIPDGQDHSIDAVRYAMMDDVLRGSSGFAPASVPFFPERPICSCVIFRRFSRRLAFVERFDLVRKREHLFAILFERHDSLCARVGRYYHLVA